MKNRYLACFVISTILAAGRVSYADDNEIDPTLANLAFQSDEQAWNTIYQEVASLLPEYTAETLVNAEDSVFWIPELDAELLSLAVYDVVPEESFTEGSMWIAIDDDRSMRFDDEVGRLVYTSYARAHVYGISPNTPVDDGDAIALAFETALSLDVSDEQLFGPSVDHLAAGHVHHDAGTGEAELLDKWITETVVSYARRVDGVPVMGSYCRVGVTNNGEIARVQLRWPDFYIPERETLVAKSRSDIETEITNRIYQLDWAGVDNILMFVVYTQIVPGRNYGYVPGVAVHIKSTAESSPILVETFSLVN